MTTRDFIGQPVVIRVRVGQVRIPLRGRLISESADTLQLQVADDWQFPVDRALVETIALDTRAGNQGAE